MANLETGSQSQELFDTTGARELIDGQEIQEMFDDQFFKDLESTDPLVRIEKQEIGGKVYFSKPDNDKTKIRAVGQNGVFVDIFCVSKENWNNIINRRNGINGAVQTAHTETQQLHQEVATNTPVTQYNPQENPEILGTSVEAHVDDLLVWFDKFNDHWPQPKRPGESRRTLERLKSVVRNDIAYLKSIKRELKRYTYTGNPEIFQADLNELERQKPILDDVRQRISRGDDTDNIPTILGSLRDVKRADKFENKMAKYNKKVNEILKDATLKKLWNEDMEGFQDYLEDVWSGAIEHPEQCRFYTRHMKDFLNIQSINPALYAEITTCKNPKKQNIDQYVAQCMAGQGHEVGHCQKRKGAFEKGGELLPDLLVAAGVIDENDTTKREARGKFGKTALLGLGAYAVYKIFTTKGSERWKWIGGTTATFLGMANKDSIIQRFKDAFGKTNPTPNEVMDNMNYQATGGTRPTSVDTQEVIDTLVSPATTTIGAIGSISINDLINENIISTDSNGNFVFNYDNHREYINTHVVNEDEKRVNLQAGEKLKKNPQWINTGLAALGITSMGVLQAAGRDNDNTLLESDSLANYCDNLRSPINAKISKEGFKPKDAQARYQIMYENNGKNSISTADMARYIREGLIVPKDSSLTLYINSPLTNLENKCMTDCGEIRFDTYEELLKAVKLTEWIITEFKGRTNAHSDNPFHEGLAGLGGNIEFDDGYINDTDVLRANIFHNTLKQISPKLNSNKRTYVKYLNMLWHSDVQTVREKVDLSTYPILNAMGIDFYNKQEAQQAEAWLEEIKDGTKFSQGAENGQPFTVKWKITKWGERLVFTAVNGDKEVFNEDISDKFPTLRNHKDEFLAFLNNPANDMWGSGL